jgi:putative nucleotidyltransferase with HDIG domain/PAS domain S-box-containing protein
LDADVRAPIVFIVGAHGTMEYIDAQGAAFVGLAPTDICGQSWFHLVHPDDVDVARAEWKQARCRRLPYEGELRICNGAGTYRLMAETASPVLAIDGTIDRWVCTLTDVEHDKHTDEQRRHLDDDANETHALLDTIWSTAPVGFLFMDREFRYVRVNEIVAALDGAATVDEHLGRTLAEVAPALWPQLAPHCQKVLESGQPVLNLELSGDSRIDPGKIHYWLDNIYPVRVDTEIVGLGVIFIDITDRKENETALVALTEASVDAIANAAEVRDPYTAGHQRRVAELAVAIAIDLGLNQHDVDGLRLAAKIHDIGKLAIPSQILNKPSELRPTEFALIKEHAQVGSDIVRGIDFPWPIADVILQHHERVDGSGYPAGLVGDEILLGARIVAVADVVEAMSSHRPYRPSLGIAAALSEIEIGRGTLYDAEVVDVCLHRFREDGWRFPIGEQSGGAASDHDIPIDAGVVDDLT